LFDLENELITVIIFYKLCDLKNKFITLVIFTSQN